MLVDGVIDERLPWHPAVTLAAAVIPTRAGMAEGASRGDQISF